MFIQWPVYILKKSTEIFFCTLALEMLMMVNGANNDNMPSMSAQKSLGEINPTQIRLDNNNNEEYSKRGWKTNLPMWGKRGWTNLHSGWGKRDFPITDESMMEESSADYFPQINKKAWQRLQGGWGKRFSPYNNEEDEIIAQKLAEILNENYNNNDNNINNSYPDYQDDEQQFPGLSSSHEMNKRDWKSFAGGWGKRNLERNTNKWDRFRGSWGKRQPAWNNLKGLWGKRSISEY